MRDDPSPLRLLAKSWEGPGNLPPWALLTGHTVQVVTAAERLLALRGEASLRAAGLPLTLLPRLTQLVLVAALIHDLGKCSAHFQDMVRHRGPGQLVRHEAASAWLAWREPLRGWLVKALTDPADIALAIAAAAGHHRKFLADAVNMTHGLGTRMRLLSGHVDVEGVLCYAAKVLGLGEPPKLTDLEIIISIGGPKKVFQELEQAVLSSLSADPYAPVLLALAKALVLDADVAGSALPRSGEKVEWIIRQLSQRAGAAELDRLISKRLGGCNLRPFQSAVATCSAPVVLVEAGCGCGKTLAAYAWFAKQHAGRQLWITYPTTGTALEGFRDYLHGIDGLVSDLESGRREIDLDLCGLRERMDEDDAHRDAERIASLRAWGHHAIACTVDTVLGLVQNQRKGLYAWAGLADGAVVFDEIHAYDDRLFGCLLHFLNHLPGIPALLMTASLPQARRDALEALCQKRHATSLTVIPGPADLEQLPRYRLEVLTADVDPWPQVAATLAGGGKVLWVANTVDRCLTRADEAHNRQFDALIYHSRFRYVDRVVRHKAVVDGFRSSGPCLAVTTQVAEMSLDLSADLLVTDLAPIPSIIQRLGRLNRRSTPDNPQPVRPALILPFVGPLPYDAVILEEAGEWLAKLIDKDCSQQDLVRAWIPRVTPVDPVGCAWMDGGFETTPRAVRDSSPGITVLRHEDAAAVRADAKQALSLALPMTQPRGADAKAWLTWPRLNHLPIAPSDRIIYDPLRGAQWVK